jgi:putative membrane protein
MLGFVVHVLITAGLLLFIAQLIDGLDVDSGAAALWGALVLGIANAIVRPVLVVLTLPLTIITLGLFLLVVNAAVFGLAAALVPGFRVRSFWAALVGSVLLTVFNLVISVVFGL